MSDLPAPQTRLAYIDGLLVNSERSQLTDLLDPENLRRTLTALTEDVIGDLAKVSGNSDLMTQTRNQGSCELQDTGGSFDSWSPSQGPQTHFLPSYQA